jgi:hypothetical protein
MWEIQFPFTTTKIFQKNFREKWPINIPVTAGRRLN